VILSHSSSKLSFRLTVIAGIFFVYSIAQSQSLDEAIQSALLQYPTIIAAQARLDSSKSDITRAESQHYPQVSWRGTSSNYNGVNTSRGAQASGIAPDNTWIQSPYIYLNIWAGGRIQADVDRSTALSVARFQQQRLTRDEVALTALEAYLTWARAHDLVKLARANVQAHKKLLQDVTQITLLDQGRMLDQHQAEVRLENAQLILKERETELAVAAQRLERMLLGVLPKKPVGVDKIRGVVPLTAQAALGYVNDLHPAIAAQLAQIEAARAVLASARSEYFPTVDISYGKQFTQGTGQGDYITQLSVNIPIFTGGSTYGRVGSASNELIATQQGLNEKRLLVKERILSVWPELNASRIRKEIAQQQARTGLRVVNGYQQQFLVGRRSLLDLLTVQNDLYRYQSSETIATYEKYLAKGRMLAAIGRLAAAYQSSQSTSKEPISLEAPLLKSEQDGTNTPALFCGPSKYLRSPSCPALE
jgi:adhesin transport system outer membrane protein